MSQGPRTHHRLLYGSIELIPVHLDPELGYARDIWHLPGGRMETTEELLRLAAMRDVQVSKLTITGLDRTLESLN